jgi:5-(carboxyamino)imidazole ribonucleotide mutase
MAKPLVVILMGSKTDLGHCQKIADACMSYGIEVTMRIGSAHKTPEHILKFLKKYEADPRPKVYITVAGRSNALSGFTDGAVSAPVIACPPSLDSFGGADIYSSLRMPSGVAPAVVLEPVNVALLAAKILGLVDEDVHTAVIESQKHSSRKTIEDDKTIQ